MNLVTNTDPGLIRITYPFRGCPCRAPASGSTGDTRCTWARSHCGPAFHARTNAESHRPTHEWDKGIRPTGAAMTCEREYGIGRCHKDGLIAYDGAPGSDAALAPVVRVGSPKRVLTEEADEWNADCIFVGAHGLRGQTVWRPGASPRRSACAPSAAARSYTPRRRWRDPWDRRRLSKERSPWSSGSGTFIPCGER